MAVSDSVTDVNLPVLSKKFKENFDEFKQMFSSNFDKVFAFILFAGGSATYWVGEIVYFVIDGQKYAASYHLILPIVFAFIFYSIVNIVKSSILIPAGFIKEMILSFVLMLAVTLLGYFGLHNLLGPISSMAWGMVFGSFSCALCMIIISETKINYQFLNKSHGILLGVVYFLCAANLPMFSHIKFLCYSIFVPLYITLLFKYEYVTWVQIKPIFDKIFKVKKEKD
jgi:O-antigen/teichoic acid export membrane protein